MIKPSVARRAKHRLDPPHSDGGRTKAKYRKNEVIFRQGDSADAVFYMMDGKCKATVVSEAAGKPWSLSMKRVTSLVRAA